MSDWTAIIEVWPFHTGEGAATAKAGVAPAIRQFEFDANDFHEAARIARLMNEAVGSHDKVWHANVRCVAQKGFHPHPETRNDR